MCHVCLFCHFIIYNTYTCIPLWRDHTLLCCLPHFLPPPPHHLSTSKETLLWACYTTKIFWMRDDTYMTQMICFYYPNLLTAQHRGQPFALQLDHHWLRRLRLYFKFVFKVHQRVRHEADVVLTAHPWSYDSLLAWEFTCKKEKKRILLVK